VVTAALLQRHTSLMKTGEFQSCTFAGMQCQQPVPVQIILLCGYIYITAKPAIKVGNWLQWYPLFTHCHNSKYPPSLITSGMNHTPPPIRCERSSSAWFKKSRRPPIG